MLPNYLIKNTLQSFLSILITGTS